MWRIAREQVDERYGELTIGELIERFGEGAGRRDRTRSGHRTSSEYERLLVGEPALHGGLRPVGADRGAPVGPGHRRLHGRPARRRGDTRPADRRRAHHPQRGRPRDRRRHPLAHRQPASAGHRRDRRHRAHALRSARGGRSRAPCTGRATVRRRGPDELAIELGEFHGPGGEPARPGRRILREHPLLRRVPVHGLIFDVATGRLPRSRRPLVPAIPTTIRLQRRGPTLRGSCRPRARILDAPVRERTPATMQWKRNSGFDRIEDRRGQSGGGLGGMLGGGRSGGGSRSRSPAARPAAASAGIIVVVVLFLLTSGVLGGGAGSGAGGGGNGPARRHPGPAGGDGSHPRRRDREHPGLLARPTFEAGGRRPCR